MKEHPDYKYRPRRKPKPATSASAKASHQPHQHVQPQHVHDSFHKSFLPSAESYLNLHRSLFATHAPLTGLSPPDVSTDVPRHSFDPSHFLASSFASSHEHKTPGFLDLKACHPPTAFSHQNPAMASLYSSLMPYPAACPPGAKLSVSPPTSSPALMSASASLAASSPQRFPFNHRLPWNLLPSSFPTMA